MVKLDGIETRVGWSLIRVTTVVAETGLLRVIVQVEEVPLWIIVGEQEIPKRIGGTGATGVIVTIPPPEVTTAGIDAAEVV
jgi:hypothetical protein